MEAVRDPRGTLPAVAVGGALGAAARHALELAWRTPVGGFPWATFVVNVSGCLLIGLLVAAVLDRGRGHPLARPFLAVGVLGGYTTFSTYAVQTHDLLDGGEPVVAAAYLVGSVLAGLLATAVGLRLGRDR